MQKRVLRRGKSMFLPIGRPGCFAELAMTTGHSFWSGLSACSCKKASLTDSKLLPKDMFQKPIAPDQLSPRPQMVAPRGVPWGPFAMASFDRVEVAVLGFGDKQHADHEGHQREADRIPQARVDIAS